MYVRMYVCTYACMSVYTCTCIHTYIHAYIHTYTFTEASEQADPVEAFDRLFFRLETQEARAFFRFSAWFGELRK